MAARRQGDLVERVEQRLLVLLQVAVVGQGQALERGQQPGQVADEAARLAPGQLGDVGVLLLRAASSCRWRTRRPAAGTRTRRVDHRTISSPSRDRCRPIRVRPNRASATKSRSRHGVEGVVEHGGEAEVGGHPRRVERQRRPGQRSGAQRARRPGGGGSRAGGRRRGPAPSRGPAGGGPAAPAGPAAGGCSRAGRRRRPAGPGRAAPAGARAPGRPPASSSRLVNRRRSVATWSLRLRPVCSLAPAGPAISVTRRSTAVWMSSSDGHERRRSPSASSTADLVEGGQHGVGLDQAEHAGPHQAPDVGPRAGEVVGGQRLVVGQAHGEGQQRVGRAALEATVPERAHAGGVTVAPVAADVARRSASARPGPCWADQVCRPRPHSRTKPSESAWLKVSAAS